MFREMRRFKQQLDREECIELLKNEPRGVLAVLGDDDYPYAVPLNFVYDEKTGTLCFHGAKEGHKLDAVKKCGKASFCAYDKGFRREGEWALNIRSVIVFGRMRIVEDYDRAVDICRMLGNKFYPSAEEVEAEIRKDAGHVLCMELIPEHITGKLVNES